MRVPECYRARQRVHPSSSRRWNKSRSWREPRPDTAGRPALPPERQPSTCRRKFSLAVPGSAGCRRPALPSRPSPCAAARPPRLVSSRSAASGETCRHPQDKPGGGARPPHPFPVRPPGDVTVRCGRGDRPRGRRLPLGVHIGDHMVDQVGDPVRTPPPPVGEDTGQWPCEGIRWYPRLACPQAGGHIGAGSRSRPSSRALLFRPRSTTSPTPSFPLVPVLSRAVSFPHFPPAFLPFRGFGGFTRVVDLREHRSAAFQCSTTGRKAAAATGSVDKSGKSPEISCQPCCAVRGAES